MDFSPWALYSTGEDWCCEMTFSSPAVGMGLLTRGACNLTATAVITLSLKLAEPWINSGVFHDGPRFANPVASPIMRFVRFFAHTAPATGS